MLSLQVKTLPLHHRVIIRDTLAQVILKIVQNVNIATTLDIQLYMLEAVLETPLPTQLIC